MKIGIRSPDKQPQDCVERQRGLNPGGRSCCMHAYTAGECMLGSVHPPECAQLLLTTSQRTPRLVRSTSCGYGEAQQVQRSQYGLCWLLQICLPVLAGRAFACAARRVCTCPSGSCEERTCAIPLRSVKESGRRGVDRRKAPTTSAALCQLLQQLTLLCVQDIALWRQLAGLSTKQEPPMLRQAIYCLSKVCLPCCTSVACASCNTMR